MVVAMTVMVPAAKQKRAHDVHRQTDDRNDGSLPERDRPRIHQTLNDSNAIPSATTPRISAEGVEFMVDRHHTSRLFRVTADHRDQLFGAGGAVFVIEVGPGEMLTHIILDDLIHQPVDRTASGRDLLKHGRATRVRLKRAFHRRDLPRDPAGTGDKLPLVVLGV